MSQKKLSKFKRAIQWIADEDEPLELDCEVIQDSISVLLIAEVFEKDPEEIARLIVQHRTKKRK